MRPSAKLVSLATAVPPNVLSQSDVAAPANQSPDFKFAPFKGEKRGNSSASANGGFLRI